MRISHQGITPSCYGRCDSRSHTKNTHLIKIKQVVYWHIYCIKYDYINGISNMKKNEVKNDAEIAFYMETSFHFEVYRNIIAELINRKVHCELVINDLIEANFVNEMLSTLSVMNIPGLGCTLLSAVLATSKKYSCMVTPYYIKGLESISPIHIRAIYGLAKNHWNHAPWNAEYNAILCYSHYTKKSLMLGDKAHIVGNPRFDDWHNQTYSQKLPKDLKLESKKPTILYAPTYGSLSSLPYWAEKLNSCAE